MGPTSRPRSKFIHACTCLFNCDFLTISARPRWVSSSTVSLCCFRVGFSRGCGTQMLDPRSYGASPLAIQALSH